MEDLDRALARLADAPAPAALDDIDARVLARIGARPSTRAAGLGIGAVAVAALVIGMAGAGLPVSARAGATLAPLGGVSPLAPSTLLATGQ
jgi:hypothetical protein